MTRVVLKGASVVDESGVRLADVAINTDSGRVQACETDLNCHDDDLIIDVAGCFVSPGFVDLHAHLGEPGNEAAETIMTGSRAAALGGYSAVVAMPDTDPCADSAVVIDMVKSLGAQALCLVRPAGAVSLELAGSVLAPMGEMAGRGVTMFSDCGSGIQDAGFMRQALNYVSDLVDPAANPCRIAQRCDLQTLSAGGQMHEGEWSSQLGLPGIPSEAEQIMVAQALALAAMSGAPLHLQHLSTAGSFELVRQAKAAGVLVTADVSPHHLLLTDANCAGYDSNYKVQPPLRLRSDTEAAKLALIDGTIDAVATGHAPQRPDTKERPFDQAPPGILGFETALAVLVDDVKLDVETIVACMSRRPANIAGLAHVVAARIESGSMANLTVIDPNKTWVCDPAKLASRAGNTPFAGRTFTAKIRHTLLNGEFVVQNFEATR